MLQYVQLIFERYFLVLTSKGKVKGKKEVRYTYLLKTILLVFTCILTLSAVGCADKSTTSTQLIDDITAQEAFTLLQDNQGNSEFTIIDVRTPAEFSDGHIENAINIDFNSNGFENEISKLDRNKEYLIYCRSGNRSSGALEVMKELGFMNIYHLYEGIIGWTDSGYPTVQ